MGDGLKRAFAAAQATRSARLELRCTPEEKALIEHAAQYEGVEAAPAVRREALAWAKWVLGIGPKEAKR